ncbi:MAG: DUF885 family protein [Alphaproteobacteria bacterium]|nr:DUF885 family protein [Alphaproteobacteria bacterium]MDE2501000.1 DUF885 family protein [Alphaproteobacteria bacterium]
MLDRRSVLRSGTALTLLAVSGEALAKTSTPANPEAAKLNALFDTFMSEILDRSPEFVTSLGLDTGNRAYQKSMLGSRSLAEVAALKQLNTSQLTRLRAINRGALSGMDAVNYDAVLYGVQQQEDSDKRFQYGAIGAGAPYVLTQLTGAYQNVPDFLDSQHQIANKTDADDYLARLTAFGEVLNQECEVTAHDVALGVIPPDFILSRALEQMTTLRGQPAEKSPLVNSVVRRTKEKKIAGDYAGQATRIVNEIVYPALDRQMALLKSLQPKAVHDAGVWRLKDGAAYYQASLESQTTTTMKPEEIHQLGLDVVKDHSAKIDALMKANGLTKGTVGERLRAMYADPKFRYPNTDAGKDKLIADLNVRVRQIRALLPKYFGTVPKAALVIKRVPKYIEAGAPGGYYQPGSLDGKRPGTYYINLRDTAEVPSWTLPTLTYHEGIPGHHLQISIAQETSLPLIRKIGGYTAYVEGWALYSEQLAAEIGLYDKDPWGHIGQLHDSMFRGVRLVVDTGLHAMRWSREQAIKYYADTLGDPVSGVTTEVERYCVWPGQACCYMIGKLDILRLRDKAKAALGARFDIHKFHDTVLLSGALPLAVLDKLVDGYIAANKA